MTAWYSEFTSAIGRGLSAATDSRTFDIPPRLRYRCAAFGMSHSRERGHVQRTQGLAASGWPGRGRVYPAGDHGTVCAIEEVAGLSRARIPGAHAGPRGWSSSSNMTSSSGDVDDESRTCACILRPSRDRPRATKNASRRHKAQHSPERKQRECRSEPPQPQISAVMALDSLSTRRREWFCYVVPQQLPHT